MTSLEEKVFIQPSDTLNGVLRIQSVDTKFKKELQPFLDQYDTFRKREDILQFDKLAQEYNLQFVYQGDAEKEYELLKEAVSTEFKVDAPFFKNKSLYKFQTVGLNLSYRVLSDFDNPRFLLQWDTGCGKTTGAVLLAQRLVNEGKVDLVLVFCKRTKVLDWEEEFLSSTDLTTSHIGSDLERKIRHLRYEDWNNQVLVTNYEKARYPSSKKNRKTKKLELDWGRTDLYEILQLVDGKRVLIIIDEAQKINTDETLLSRGFNTLLNSMIPGLAPSKAMVLGLTATPYTTSPLNIRNIFSVLIPNLDGVSINPLEFKQEYAEDFEEDNPWIGQYGRVKKWDLEKLSLLGKRHEIYTHAVTKLDPEIASQFPTTTETRILLELSEKDREVYEYAQQLIKVNEEETNFQTVFGYLNLLRMICNTTEGLHISESYISQQIVQKFGKRLLTKNSSKYQVLQEFLETRVENSEKTVLFTFWTNNTLFPYLRQLKKDLPGVPIFTIHGGEGLTNAYIANEVESFNKIKGPAILLSSDVGQEGLNLYAPYLLHIELPTLYSTYKQRSDRIDRADSISKGIDHTWVYSFVTEDTVERNVEKRVLQRKNESEAIKGLTTGGEAERFSLSDLREILFK